MMQLFFRVEGNENVGLGHIMRCFALSQAAQGDNIEVVFICNQASKNFLLSRHQWHGKIVVIDDSHWNPSAIVDLRSERNKHEIEFIKKCMLRFALNKYAQSRQMLVLDGYQFDHSYQKALSKVGIHFAYLDDINTFLEQKKMHVANIVINGAASARQLGYEKNTPNSRLCLGTQYLLLRPEFINLPLIPIANRRSLLICFGGADLQKHTENILWALSKLKFQCPVTIVTGAAYKDQAQLVNRIKDGFLSYDTVKQKISMPIQYIHDAQNMADIMMHSRLCISAAGGSQFELMRCYTPSFLVVVADNQMPAATESSKQGWCASVDWRHQFDYIGLAKQVVASYADTESLMVKQVRAYECAENEAYYGADNVLYILHEFAKG
jgi:UDP-2,4-diacetamido-2,4,6-trideoxy-beta-L-altropyranose hydrolase